MAVEHLRDSVTKRNLWLYVLAILRAGAASPSEIEDGVSSRFGFSPAKITFYSVLYKMRKEGLVEKSSGSFRSKYRITEKGERAIQEGVVALAAVIAKLKAPER